MAKKSRTARKTQGKFSSHDLITYLRDENLFLRGELAKMSDLCSRLADSKQTPVNDKVSPPVHFNQTTPLQTHVETPFVLPRRTTMPRKNTWEPTVLSTSFSALSVEDTVENSAIVIPTHDENVTTRKRSSVQMMHPNKRPQVTTNEKYLQNYVPVVPGNKTYSQAANGSGNDILVIGSSMLQRIRKRELARYVESGPTKIKVFPGAPLDKLNYYLVPELMENKFRKVVVHCGTNDLYSKTAEEIVAEMQVVRDTCLRYGVDNVYISSIIFRRCSASMEEKRQLVNSLMRGLCEGEWVGNTIFVDNSNILDFDLYTDGLHLVETGSVKLANNIIRALNKN